MRIAPQFRITRCLVLLLAVSTTSHANILAATPVADFRDVEYASVDGISLKLDIYSAPNAVAAPVVLWMHGGGWNTNDKSLPYIKLNIDSLRSHGLSLVSIDYRLSRQAKFPAQILDCKAAVRWIRANAAHYHFDADRSNPGVWNPCRSGLCNVPLARCQP